MKAQPEVKALKVKAAKKAQAFSSDTFAKEPTPNSHGFSQSATFLSDLDFQQVTSLIAASADLVLVLDRDGVIQDASVQGGELQREGYRKWIGQQWIDTVTFESREKVTQMLEQASDLDLAFQNYRPRQVNHASVFGPDVPIAYTLAPLSRKNLIVAFGRDMRPFADLQVKLVDAQRAMERDYWQLRYLESRYRALTQTSTEGVLTLDAGNFKVLEANASAEHFVLGANARGSAKLVGKSFAECFEESAQSELKQWLTTLKVARSAQSFECQPILKANASLRLNGAYIKQESANCLLICVQPVSGSVSLPKQSQAQDEVVALLTQSSDAFVATDSDQKIIFCNTAFAELAQLAHPTAALGDALEHHFNRPEVDLNVMLANLRRSSTLRHYAAAIRGAHGSVSQVEISAVAVGTPSSHFGFIMRHVREERIGRSNQDGELAQKSVDQLTELVGRVPLKDLVRESTDMIEKLCLEAALKLTHNNRASASELLGMSRQSFYSKLNRHGIQD